MSEVSETGAAGVAILLKGQVGIVTGGASGIGRCIAEVFAEAGISGLTVADTNVSGAEEVVNSLRARYNCSAIATQTDVSKQDLVERMVEVTVDKFGRIDILVNNAGICPLTPWDDATLETWNRIVEINLTGSYLCTKAVLPHMRRRKYGRIVYISSIGAFQGSLVGHVAYGVSKAGMIALMKSVAKGFGGEGINANAVAPGTIDTPLASSLGEAAISRLQEGTPLRRQGTPREVADAVLFLASNRASYISGATLQVNGASLLV
jgi:3-oxoacyl-[acyl-carrier protein] reductase